MEKGLVPILISKPIGGVMSILFVKFSPLTIKFCGLEELPTGIVPNEGSDEVLTVIVGVFVLVNKTLKLSN